MNKPGSQNTSHLEKEKNGTFAPPPSKAIAKFESVTKRFKNHSAVEDVSFDLHPGEIVALLGPNGAGKTTSVRLLLGLSSPSKGTIRVFDGDPRNHVTRTRIGVMLQVGSASAQGQLYVRELIELFSSYYPAPLSLSEVIKLAAIEGIENKRFGKLSGGQQQRVLFALAICGNPDLLILDEPTVGMDIEARRALWERIRAIATAGKTVLVTTHYLEEADQLASRILVMQAGHLIAQGTPAELKASQSQREIRCRTNISTERLMAIPSVSAVRIEGQTTIISTKEPDEVIRQLVSLDPSLTDIETSKIALEDAFLALTGLG